MTYNRPALPYSNVALPYDNRYENLANNDRPPTAQMLDADVNYLVDTANALKVLIDNVSAGILVGSEDPLNANKLPTTDGNSNISWILIDTDQLEPNAVTQDKIDTGAVGAAQYQNGSITNVALAPQCVNTSNYVLESIGTNQIADLAITNPKIADNAIEQNNYAALSIPTAAIQNQAIGTAQLQNASITLAQLAADAMAFLVPTGVVLPYGGAAAPSAAWLLADGSAVSRVTYATLFGIYGTTFGAGDGVTTFNLPDLRGNVIAGSIANSTNGRITVATANNTNIGGTGGFEQITLAINQIPSHTHTYTVVSGSSNFAGGAGPTALTSVTGQNTGATGGGLAHNNMPPFLLLNYIIKT